MLASKLIEDLVWAVEKVGNVGILLQTGETLDLKVETLEEADLIIITTKSKEEVAAEKQVGPCIFCSVDLNIANNGFNHSEYLKPKFCQNCGKKLTV